jgi:hypothetical protein
MIRFGILSVLLISAVNASNVTLVQNRTFASQNCTMDTNLTMTRANTTALDYNCRTQVYDSYANDTKQNVQQVARGSLNCTALNLSPEMTNFTVIVQNTTFAAYRTSFENLHERYVWNGMLYNRGGLMSVVWDSICNVSVFQLDILLPNKQNGSQTQLTTRPCENSTVPNCLWTVELTVEKRQEEPPKMKTLDINLHDTDIPLLNNGTVRRKLSNNQVEMHSGRTLDDGSIIKVLYVYSTKTLQRYGQATITSMIASGHASLNEAFYNSQLPFQFLSMAIVGVPYTESSMTQTLADLVQGSVPWVQDMRNKYAADVVQMVVEDPSYCGYSYMMSSPNTGFAPYAFNVIYSGCFGQYSNIHEIGHTLGLDHNTEDSSHSSIYPYALGSRLCNDGRTSPQNANVPYWRTVMSYNCANSLRIPLLSGPFVYFQGKATGNYDVNNQYVARENYQTVANFRTG